MPLHEITLTVNGTTHELAVEPRTLLIHALRDHLGYTGPNVGCDTSRCGTCTVRLDGRTIKSCTRFAVQEDGAEVETIEGLTEGGELTDLQRQFRAEHGLQCGFCTPGMIFSAEALLASNPDPTRAEIREGLKGNLCRCTGYHNIVDAVERTAADRRGEP
ncbi:(2Fe-2S)-binding protein [Haloferacaceae archaeon DSL9]